MKNTMYKLLFVLCLFAGLSCTQNNQEEEESAENQNQPAAADTDTSTVSGEVPESLQQH